MSVRKNYHPQCDNVLPKKMNMVRSMIVMLYYIPFKIREIDSKISEIRDDMASVRGVNYDKIPSDGNGTVSRDIRLAEMVTELTELQDERIALMKKDTDIRSQLHWLDLTPEEVSIIDAVNTTGSYYDAGMKIGYSKIQIYRKINEIYRKLARYV